MSLSRAQRQRIVQIAKGRSEEPLRLLEGPKAIRDALDREQVAEVWMRTGDPTDLLVEIVAAAQAGGVPVNEVTRAELDRLGSTVTPQGVFALVRDTAMPIDDVVQLPGLALWLDEVQDPGNVGAIMRIAAAFGVGGVLVGTGTADPLGTKALRASAGLALQVPFTRANSAAIATAVLACARPVWTLEAGGPSVHDAGEVPPGLVLALGSEGHGFGEEVRRVAAQSVGIDIAEPVESLNVAVAAGIAVSTLVRAEAGS